MKPAQRPPLAGREREAPLDDLTCMYNIDPQMQRFFASHCKCVCLSVYSVLYVCVLVIVLFAT